MSRDGLDCDKKIEDADLTKLIASELWKAEKPVKEKKWNFWQIAHIQKIKAIFLIQNKMQKYT